MSTRLILIRHGQTDWGQQRRYCSFTNIELNAAGKSQADKLWQRLSREVIDKIYSSDIKRAYQFAGLIFRNPSIEEIKSFREINFGQFEGLTHQEIMDKHPIVYQNWLNNLYGVNIPGGESLKDLAKRVRNSLEEILSLNTGLTIAICAHAGPIRVILSDAQGLGLDKIWQVKVDCASLSRVEFINGKAKVVSVNDIEHLNG